MNDGLTKGARRSKAGIRTFLGDRSALSLVESLNYVAMWTYAVCYLLIASSISFLIFLWSSNGSNLVWHRIALAGFMTRFVSLSATLLRLGMAMQAATATSLLAALLLQEHLVPLLHAPAVSMMQWQNSGPWTLMQLLWPQFTLPRGLWAWTAIAMLTLISTMSQFSSTLLLTDVRTTSTISDQSAQLVPSDLNNTGTAVEVYVDFASVSYTISKPDLFPTFAEYREPPPKAGGGFYDTGPVYRAFLPVTNQTQRTALSTFSGKAIQSPCRRKY